jgi:hypothetical protein
MIDTPRQHPHGMTAQHEIGRLLDATGGLIVRRNHPDLATGIDWAVHNGS